MDSGSEWSSISEDTQGSLVKQIPGPDKKSADKPLTIHSRSEIDKETTESHIEGHTVADPLTAEYTSITRHGMADDSCSSFDYDEFGHIEVCYPDRLIIRPTHGALPIDAVLFDQHGNFIGPISEVVGGPLNLRYIIQISEDLFRTRRFSLKPNDSVYYYNCDRLEVDPPCMDEEEPTDNVVLEQRKRKTKRYPKRDKKISKMILKSVINNLRNLSIGEQDDSFENNRDRDSQLANKSTSITSMIFKSYQNKSKIDSVKEQLKKKKYRKYKHRIIQHFYKFQEESIIPHTPYQPDEKLPKRPSVDHLFEPNFYTSTCGEPIQDELDTLGKRTQPIAVRPKRRRKTSKHLPQESEMTATNHHQSSGSSRLSHISEPSPKLFGAIKAVSELHTPGNESCLTLSTHKESFQLGHFDLHSEFGIEDELRMDQEPLCHAFKFSQPLPSFSSHSVREGQKSCHHKPLLPKRAFLHPEDK